MAIVNESMSSVLICIASVAASAFFLWQADKAIGFHICAFRSVRTQQDLSDLLRAHENPVSVPLKIIPAIVVMVGVGFMTLENHSIFGLTLFAIGVAAFCVSSALHAYAALNRSSGT